MKIWITRTAIAIVVVFGTTACPTTASQPGGPPTPPPPPSVAATPSVRSVTAPPVVTNAQGVPPRVNNLVVDFVPDSICTKSWSIVIRVETQGTKPGDPVHLTLTGPNMPSELNGTVGADLRYAPTLGPFAALGAVGPGRFVVTVDRVAGSTAQTPSVNEQRYTCS